MAQDNVILDFFKWFVRPFDWPKSVYQDLKHWYVMRKICNEDAVKQIFKNHSPEIRHDRIYRLYTVINIPEDLYEGKLSGARETFLIDELRKIEALTLRLGVSEILYPEYNIITDIPESYAYLLTLETDKESLSWLKGFTWIFKSFLWFCIIAALNALIINTTGNSIIGWVASLF